MPREVSREEEAADVRPSHGISLDLPTVDGNPQRPAIVSHLSSPSYESPIRHHRRQPSTPRRVKETLHARSEYTNSEDDGTAVHRINQYAIKQEIGRGSFGAVHLAVDQNGIEYAVKEFSKSRLRKRAQSNILRRPHGSARPGHLAAGGFNHPLHQHSASDIHDQEGRGNPLYLIKEEIAIMKKLNHPNLVSLIEVLDDPNEDSLYMVLEMCKKGVVMKVGMNEKADPYDPESCRCWFRDLILGIEYLHAQGVVHRDIKPDNLLLTEDDVLKIVDFGVSEMFEKQSDMMTAKSAGSPAFLPPELCVGRHGGVSGKAADIWSMGVTLYCLHFGKVPFEKFVVLDLYESIKNDTLQVEGECEDNFKDLIFQLLEKDPSRRIQMPELREHPWVTKNGTDPLLSAEENTAYLVEPPTEEEMNRAITGNLSNLIVVMKAVNKFKSLLSRRRPYLMNSILGQGARIVQPPLSMKTEGLGQVPRKSRSMDAHDRRPVEAALVREGVHRTIEADMMDISPPDREDGAVLQSPIQESTGSRDMPRHGDSTHSPRSLNAHPQDHRLGGGSQPRGGEHQKESAKGHAHDPLDDMIILKIGPFASDNPPDPPAVSDSPPAADINIYDTAYHEEIGRIRERHGAQTALYLTRRVEDKPEYQEDENLIGRDDRRSGATSGFANLLTQVREKGAERRQDSAQPADEDNGGRSPDTDARKDR
ncbi:hypothetical protein MMC13_005501 [Lambiella insularis]|nr:hypothetical protein [Lambiella insularis]